ncbi:MAG: PQQ-dependent sugar dehydrogenase [Planctomycetes bacterium]|nr:PQQ-dependent sugar dehydrogenase [Planctomycetota bacterium]
MKVTHILTIFLSFFFACLIANADENKRYKLKNAFKNLSFDNPLDLQHPGDGTNRIFVVSQDGLIYVFNNNPSVKSAKIFLDIRDKVTSGGELGLLGLAFHPDYKTNGYFYVNYTASNPLRTVIARYTVSSKSRNDANKNSERILFQVNQPYSVHNGGQLAFGPDGYLYIALGNGGSGGDSMNNGQNKSSLLGKILRIDVDCTSENIYYCIPPENPFAGNSQGYKEEIYAYGVRNPWRFSFDPVTGWMWAGDVGQNDWEEIDIMEKGKNYGWRIMEGNHCYNPSSDCDTSGLILPIWEYEHDGQGSCSITGGYVYRGTKFPELYGKYIYGDYCSGSIWALSYDGTNPATNKLLLTADIEISSFGIDKDNEMYICDLNGKIYKLAYKKSKN